MTLGQLQLLAIIPIAIVIIIAYIKIFSSTNNYRDTDEFKYE